MLMFIILNNFRNSKVDVNTDRAGAVHEIEIETETETETTKINFTSNLSKISTMTNNLAIQGIFLYFLF